MVAPTGTRPTSSSSPSERRSRNSSATSWGRGLADELDFDTLEPLPTNRISGGLVQRQLDLLCKVRFRGGWLYLLILLEFSCWTCSGSASRIPSRGIW